MAIRITNVTHGPDEVRSSTIITAEWLANILNDKSFVVLRVGDREEWDAAHIPGA